MTQYSMKAPLSCNVSESFSSFQFIQPNSFKAHLNHLDFKLYKPTSDGVQKQIFNWSLLTRKKRFLMSSSLLPMKFWFWRLYEIINHERRHIWNLISNSKESYLLLCPGKSKVIDLLELFWKRKRKIIRT